MTDPTALRRAEAVRRFNRFYTKHVGVLDERVQRNEFSLTEVRVMQELAGSRTQTAAALTRNLGLDSGYLSRLLAGFERRDLITRSPSEVDARQSLLALTAAGYAAYEPLDAAGVAEVSAVLARLTDGSQERLIGAMMLIERLLDERQRNSMVRLRAPRAGDYGWLVHRQAQLFASGHGWDHTFEGLLAQRVAEFAQAHDPQRETCWIAEQEGIVVGSALLATVSETIADVRMLYVEPDMQRLGIGTQLLNECMRFARSAGYARLSITTESALHDARRLFDHVGFARASAVPGQRFGQKLVIERWERDL
ncbi:MAG TPA: helix-turn-helix domain-containing GNAT family N-acetyltransferase [Paraburkholderia sp.]